MGLGEFPLAGPGHKVSRGRMPCRSQLEVTGLKIDREMNGRREALAPVLPQ